MTRDDVIRLMLEADPEMIINIKDHEEGMEGFTGEDPKLLQFWPFKNYVKFAALVAAAERERLDLNAIHTCHAECQNPFCVRVREAVEHEREACALVAESYEPTCDSCPSGVANAIRGRS